MTGAASFQAVNALIAEGAALEGQIAEENSAVSDAEADLAAMKASAEVRVETLQNQLAAIPDRARALFARIDARRLELAGLVQSWAAPGNG